GNAGVYLDRRNLRRDGSHARVLAGFICHLVQDQTDGRGPAIRSCDSSGACCSLAESPVLAVSRRPAASPVGYAFRIVWVSYGGLRAQSGRLLVLPQARSYRGTLWPDEHGIGKDLPQRGVRERLRRGGMAGQLVRAASN